MCGWWIAWSESRSLQPLCAIDFAETLVKSAERKVAGFSRDFQNKTIGEFRSVCDTKLLQSRRDGFRILQGQMFVARVNGAHTFFACARRRPASTRRWFCASARVR